MDEKKIVIDLPSNWNLKIRTSTPAYASSGHWNVPFGDAIRVIVAEEIAKALAGLKADLEEDRRKREEADLFSFRALIGRRQHD